MRSFNSIVYIIVAFLTFSANVYAADYYLKIEWKGESKAQIVRCPDGSCTIDGVPAGDFTVALCDAKGTPLPEGTAKIDVYFNPKELTVDKRATATPTTPTAVATEGVKAPRDAASGLPPGKRQHKPVRIVKEWDANTPMLALKTPSDGDNAAVMHWTLEVRVHQVKMK